jgi:hypothetical protein
MAAKRGRQSLHTWRYIHITAPSLHGTILHSRITSQHNRFRVKSLQSTITSRYIHITSQYHHVMVQSLHSNHFTLQSLTLPSPRSTSCDLLQCELRIICTFYSKVTDTMSQSRILTRNVLNAAYQLYADHPILRNATQNRAMATLTVRTEIRPPGTVCGQPHRAYLRDTRCTSTQILTRCLQRALTRS